MIRFLLLLVVGGFIVFNIIGFIGDALMSPEEKAAVAEEQKAEEKQNAKEEKAKEEAKAKKKAEEEVEYQAMVHAAAKKQAEKEAKKEAEKKAKEMEAILNPNWNTKDMYGDTNGNIELAARILNSVEDDFSQNAEWLPAGEVLKAPWKYYGQVVSFSGTIGLVQDYPPNHQFSKLLGGSASQIVLSADDGTNVNYFMPFSSDGLQVGQSLIIFGFPVGLVEVDNQFGGMTTQLMMVGNVTQEN
jgi:flagellar motor protein MotB